MKAWKKESLKKNKSAEWLKKASFLETDNLQTIDYNNDVTRYLETVDFNNETQMTYLMTDIDMKKISYYCLKDPQNKKLTKRFQRAELFAVNNNFTASL